jgi:hypothetical protein
MSCSWQKVSIRSIAQLERAARRNASVAPKRFTSPSNSSCHPVAQPPLRPLAPKPHSSRSIKTTVVSGDCSRISIAAHSPV